MRHTLFFIIIFQSKEKRYNKLTIRFCYTFKFIFLLDGVRIWRSLKIKNASNLCPSVYSLEGFFSRSYNAFKFNMHKIKSFILLLNLKWGTQWNIFMQWQQIDCFAAIARNCPWSFNYANYTVSPKKWYLVIGN